MKIKLKYDEQEQRHLTLTDADWEEIELFLERVDDKFVSKLRSRFPQLTINDMRLLFLLRLRLSTKTIAEIFKISEKSIKQKLYLYKKKNRGRGRIALAPQIHRELLAFCGLLSLPHLLLLGLT